MKSVMSVVSSLPSPDRSNTSGISLRGVSQSPSVGIDWLSGTISRWDSEMFAEFSSRFGDLCLAWDNAKPSRGYKKAVRSIGGLLVSWRDDSVGCHISIPATMLNSLDRSSLWEFLKCLDSRGFRCTRLDVFSDWSSGLGGLSISDLWRWYRMGYLADRKSVV